MEHTRAPLRSGRTRLRSPKRRLPAALAAAALALGGLVVAPVVLADPIVPGLPHLPGPAPEQPRLAFADDGTSILNGDITDTWEPGNPTYPQRTEDWRYQLTESWRAPAGRGVNTDPFVLRSDDPSRWTLQAYVSDELIADEPVHPGAGDVYVESYDSDSTLLRIQRLTCDTRITSHPVIDPSGEWVAYAAREDVPGADFDVFVIPMPPSEGWDPCTEPSQAWAVADGPGDQLWPTWVSSDALAFSGPADPDGDPNGPADLFLFPYVWNDSFPPPINLTQTDADESQPVAFGVEGMAGSFTAIAFRTDQVRPDGSIAYVMCEAGDCADAAPLSITDPYEDTGDAIQGSQPAWLASRWPPMSSDYQDVDLAFTSTSGSQTGDVWAARLVADWGSGLYVEDQGRALADPFRPAGHAAARTEWPSGGFDTGRLLAAIGSDYSNLASLQASDLTDRQVLVDGLFEEGTVEQPADENAPAYSPDGRSLAYSAEFSDTDDAGQFVRGRAVLVTDAAGSGAGELLIAREPGDIDVDPVWSPDGTRLAFVRYSRDADQTEPTSLSPLWYLPGIVLVADLVAGTLEPLTAADLRLEGISQTDAAWSPEGTQVAFVRTHEPWDGAPQRPVIYVADVASGEAPPLTDTRNEQVRGRHPAWSPDGTQLVIADLWLPPDLPGAPDASLVNGDGALALVTLGEEEGDPRALDVRLLTRPAQQITEADVGAVDPSWRRLAGVAEPAWSPDGERIAFTGTDRNGEPDIWTIAPDGSGLTQATSDRRRQSGPAWQPSPDLAVALAVGASSLELGATTSVTVTVTPVGGAAPGSALTLALPAGLDLTGSPDCDSSGAGVTCDVPPLLPGGQFQVTFTVVARASGTQTMTATVTSPLPDRDPANDVATAAIVVADVEEPVEADRPRLAFTNDGTTVRRETVSIPELPWAPWSTQFEGGEISGQSSAGRQGSTFWSGSNAFVSSGQWMGGVPTVHANGDVYVALEGAGSVARVTCDASAKNHPVIDPSNEWVAWATDIGGDFDIVLAEINSDTDPCLDPPQTYVVADGPGDQLWPAWVDDFYQAGIVYSSNGAPGEPSDLWATVPEPHASGFEPVQLTNTPFDETQPAALPLLEREGGYEWINGIAIAARTDQFRPDGSIAVLVCDGYLLSDGGQCGAVLDPYASDPGARLQGSEPSWNAGAEPGETNLAFATTTDGAPGAIWLADYELAERSGDEPDGAVSIRSQGRATREPLTARSFPSWPTPWQNDDAPGGGRDEADITMTVPGAGRIDDVLATDYSQRRVVVDEVIVIGDDWELYPDEQEPAYSSDGNLLAYSLDIYAPATERPGRALAVVDWNGEPVLSPLSYEREPIDLDVDPVFSPDGRTLAFVRYTPLGPDDAQTSTAPLDYRAGRVMLVTLETGEVTPLLPDEQEEIAQLDPAWSPDAATIALSRVDGSPTGAPMDLGIHLVDAVTRELSPVLAGECDPDCSPALAVLGRHPAWSPDSSRLVVSDLTVPTISAAGLVIDARGSLAIIDLTGPDAAGTVPAAQSVEILAGTTAADQAAWQSLTNPTQPAWSPDGTRIAFSAQHAGLDATPDIATVAIDGTDLRWATRDPLRQTDPAWQPSFDVALALTASAPQVVRGTTVTVTATITASQEGPSAPGTVRVELPPGLVFAGVAPCPLVSGALECDVPGLGPGAEHTIDLALIGVDLGPALVSGHVTTTPPDRDPANNTATVQVTVIADEPTWDLGVVASAVPDVIAEGTETILTATVRADADGEGQTPAGIVRIEIPAGLSPIDPLPCPVADDALECELPPLDPGGEYVIQIPATGVAPGQHTVTATIDTDRTDRNPDNDSDAVTVEVLPEEPWDLGVTLAADPGEVTLDESTTVTATVTASEDSQTPGASLVVVIPTGLQRTGPPPCPVLLGILTCEVPPLAAGEAHAIDIALVGIAVGTPTVTATVSTDPPDHDPANNTATVQVTVIEPVRPGPPDLAVTIDVTTPVEVVDSPTRVLWQGGQPGEVTLTVRNNGQSAAPGTQLAVAWPEGLVPAASGTSTGDCLAATGTCALGSIAPGGEVVLTASLAASGPITPPAPIERSQPVPGIGPIEAPTTATITADVTSDPVPPGTTDQRVPVSTEDDSATTTIEVRLAQLRLASQVVRTGHPMTAVGYWFPPGQEVHLQWTRGITSSPGAVRVAPDGTFATTVLVLTDGLLDDRDLQALPVLTEGAVPGWGDARTRVLVVANTVVAPSFLFRN